MISGKSYVGFDLSSEGTKEFKTFNPLLNKENQYTFFEASESDINKAVELAEKSFKEFVSISGESKSNFLNAIVDEILALGDRLIEMYCSETGLPKSRALSERTRTLFQLRSFSDLVKEGSWVEASIDQAQPNRKPIPKPDIRKMSVPLGPVVVFGASNFPLAYSTAGGDTAAALAAGCPVIVKSHPMHAGTGELIASAIVKAGIKTGMPNGIFSNLNSCGIEVGVKLVKHPGVKAVGFTGSIQGGRALFDLASNRNEPIPVFAEMGSVNPIVLLPNAAMLKAEIWAKTYAESITLGAGQFCTNPGLILGIKSKDLTKFIEKLSEEIVKIDPSCMLHPNIIKTYESNKAKIVKQKGVQKAVNYNLEIDKNFARPVITTVEGKTFLKNTALHHEVFGPFSMVVQCEDMAQLEQILLNLEGQLTGTILSEGNEAESFSGVVKALQNRVGRIIFNGVPMGVEVCPSMVHGGPYPASTDSRFTAVGVQSINRWVRPFSFQNWPNYLLPDELKNENPLNIVRLVDGKQSKEPITN